MANKIYLVAEKDGERLYLIPLPLPLAGFGEFLCAWLLISPTEAVLIDCGVGGSYPALRAALDGLGASPDLLLLTHIHLDHSGAAGQLAEDFPKMRIFCFERAAKHLINPHKLWSATATTLGTATADAYRPPLPVLPDRIIGRESLPRCWKVLDTPGHAPHHVSFIRDFAGHRVCFGGEALGVIAGKQSASWFIDRTVQNGLRPATPPRYFPQVGRDSMRALGAEEWDLFCSAHFGSTTDRTIVPRALAQIDLWERTVARAVADGMSENEIIGLMLRTDPELAGIASYTEADRERELYFLGNSVRGFLEAAETAED